MSNKVLFVEARSRFHSELLESLLYTDEKEIPTIADKHSPPSCKFATGLLNRLKASTGKRLSGQASGQQFEIAVSNFLQQTFLKLSHLRPGQWNVDRASGNIAKYDQYSHLDELETMAKESPVLATALGSDYLIKPDVVIVRFPEPDSNINLGSIFVDNQVATRTPIRLNNSSYSILHASISCKWTLRSDRAQNARSEGLNLTKNRKGQSPHICVITAEPIPGRIASIALGTGEIDCVYHIALPELQSAVNETEYYDSREILQRMIEGKRLRDISDLALDLAI